MSGVRGFDNLYSESVNDVALQNYNRGIAQRLRMQQAQMDQNLPFKEPKMLGGVRFSNTILAGTTAEPPSSLAVGGRAFRTFTGNETPAQGGKVNRLKKAEKWMDFSKKAVGEAFDVYDKAKERGGKVNRLKKAEKWMDFSKKAVGNAFDVYDKAKERGGKVNRLKKAEKWMDFSKKAVSEAFDVYDKAKARGAGKKTKKAQSWTDFSKGVANDALGMYDAVNARGGMVYSPALKKALEGCGKVRKPRVARFVKGSQEAKDWGAKMKELRMKK